MTEVIRKYYDQLNNNNNSNNDCNHKTQINCPMNDSCNLKEGKYKR